MGHNHISVIISIIVSDPFSPRTPAPFEEEVSLLLWESGEGVECVAVLVHEGR